MIRFVVHIVVAGAVLYGCSNPKTGTTADLVIINAKILTIDGENPLAEALAVSGDQILAVGDNREMDQYITRTTRIIDAEKRLVTPGFNDSHAHLAGIDPDYIDLRYITKQYIIAEKVREQVARSAPGEIIMGGNWEHEMFEDRQWPTKEVIDSVSPNNPVILFRADGHSLLANSEAMKIAGVTRDTPDPFGGTIMRDANGEPTGIFQEKARGLIRYMVNEEPLSPEEQDLRDLEEWRTAMKFTASLGVTSIQRPTTSLDTAGISPDKYVQFLESGELTYRVYFCGKFPASDAQLAVYSELAEAYPRENDWIRFGFLKGHIDGTLGSGTMMVFEPFEDKPDIGLGLEQMPYSDFEDRIVAADKLGLQLGIHAIGPRANDWVLNAFGKAREVNGPRDSRHRIEHAQILREQDIPRFAELGVVASMQPSHAVTDKRFAEKRMGLDRLRGAYAWRSLLNADVKMAFGSDYIVEPLNPLDGIYAAVTRKDRLGEEGDGWFPGQKLSVEEAIELYTLGSAYAEFMEDRKGMLKAGYLADLVIFNKDLTTIDPAEILTTKVDYTIVGGRVVYSR